MPRPEPVKPLPPACLNCGEVFTAPRPTFCPACGQESNVKPPTMMEFAQQFGGGFLALEGTLWRTLKRLLFQPGELTREYLAGRRRRYILPLRMYLTISLATLLLIRLATAEDPAASRAAAQATPVQQQFDIALGDGEAGLKDGVFYCTGFPQWLCDRLQRRIDVDPKTFEREIASMQERFVGKLGTAMFILLPLYAMWLRVVYLNRHLRYTEHLVFALHVHAFWFLAMACMLPWPAVGAAAIGLTVPIYTVLAMRRLYGGRVWVTLARAATVSVLYGVSLAVVMLGVGVWTVLG